MRIFFNLILYISCIYSIDLRDFPLHEEELTDYMTFDGAYMDLPPEYDHSTYHFNNRKEKNKLRDDVLITNEIKYGAKKYTSNTNSFQNKLNRYHTKTSKSFISEENENSRYGQIFKDVEGAQKIINSVEENLKNNFNKIILYDELSELTTKSVEEIDHDFNQDNAEPLQENVDSVHSIPQNFEPIPDRSQENFEPNLEEFEAIKGRQESPENYVQEKAKDVRYIRKKIRTKVTTEETISTIPEVEPDLETNVQTDPEPQQDLEVTTLQTLSENAVNNPNDKKIYHYFRDPILNNVGRRFFYSVHRHRNKGATGNKRSNDKSKLDEVKIDWGGRCAHNPESICVFPKQCGLSYRVKGEIKCAGPERMVCCELHGFQWKLLIDESSGSKSDDEELIDIEIGSKTVSKKRKKDLSILRSKTEYNNSKDIINSFAKVNKTRRSGGRVLQYFIRKKNKKRKRRKPKLRGKSISLNRRFNRIHFYDLLHNTSPWKVKTINLDAEGITELINYLLKDAIGVSSKDEINKRTVKTFVKDNPELKKYLEKWKIKDIIKY